MAKKRTTKKPTSASLLRRSTILKKENALLHEALDSQAAAYKKHFNAQEQTIRELRDLVDRREKEIMAMVKTDAWQHKRIQTLEAEIKANDIIDAGIAARINRLEEELAKAKSTLASERKELREQLQSVCIQNERLSKQNAAALEFIRAHCFEM